MIDQRSVRLLPQQPLLRTGHHEQLTVGQPINGKRDRCRHPCDHLAITLLVERENLLGTQFDSHTRPSCQRADSPITRSAASSCGSDMRPILSAVRDWVAATSAHGRSLSLTRLRRIRPQGLKIASRKATVRAVGDTIGGKSMLLKFQSRSTPTASWLPRSAAFATSPRSATISAEDDVGAQA